MATNAVTDPGSTAVWTDERYDPLSWRWHGPALGIALAMAMATAVVALSDGLSVKDTDKMLSARSAGLFGAIAFFVALDLLPRAVMRRGASTRRSSPSRVSAGTAGASRPSASGSCRSTSPISRTGT